jgi:hypothetical protein
MPGQQLNIQATGAGYEAFAEAVLGRIAAMVPVPRAHDYVGDESSSRHGFMMNARVITTYRWCEAVRQHVRAA